MKKIPLYIDTDMGLDDIIAICMLAQSGMFDIRGVSAVNGVATVSRGVKNATRILTAIGITCPIYVGANQTQQQSTRQFPKLDRQRANNLTLLDGISLPTRGNNQIRPLADFVQGISRNPLPAILLAIGPLTNVARMLENSKVRKNISSLYIMGGAINCRGNVSPRWISEYNIRLDPKAAQRVFKLPVSTVLVPMDATTQVPAVLKCPNNQSKTITGTIIKTIIQNNASDFNYFYDPLVAATLIDPSLVRNYKGTALTVQTSGPTVGKVMSISTSDKQVKVVTSINTSRFYQLLIQMMKGGELP